ncbi:FtsK/SpoIIIE domain-containing protein [Paenarthrobacter sp. 22069]|uniref:FHA domain-containing protein n=1 Tax=Paenarthrobacter sp. 22069 TaxID=3453864 RepID=UPI003F84B040
MTLNCTLVAGPGSGLQPSLELSIDVPGGTPGHAIHEQLVGKFGAGAVTVDGEDLRSLVVGVPPLVEAAVLVDSGSAPASTRSRRRVDEVAATLALTVDSGAAAGTVMPLRRGSYSIGRSGTRIVIPDPELSREHARVVVTDTDIILIDLDSANGTFVDGERIRNAVITTDSSIRCGQSCLSLVFADLPGRVLEDAGKSVAQPIVVRGRVDPGNRLVLLLTALLPLAIGILLAVFTGMWMFLAFSAASVFSVLIPAASGRRQRRELSLAVRDAVRKDRDRRRRSAPSLPLVALAAAEAAGTGSSDPGDGVWLRLGLAEQAANVRIEAAGGDKPVPSAGMVPVLLDPARPLTTVVGLRVAVNGSIRSLLMQLAGYPAGCRTHVLVHGLPEDLPLAARFLSGVTLTSGTLAGVDAVKGKLPQGRERGVLLLLGEGSTAAGNPVREAAIQQGWRVLHFLPSEGEWPEADVLLSNRNSVLRLDGHQTGFVADLAPEDVFTNFCRSLAGSRRWNAEQSNCFPSSCSLDDILPLTAGATVERWNISGRDDRLAVPVGVSAAGTRTVDLQSDGPHLLVAGTTGAGKSELLRSFTLALAVSYPPERVNFFFIDFKGGSGLGPLSGLVHCVGLQTDLSVPELERTLTSLRAEVQLRERRLAAADVPDISTYRNTPWAHELVLPHLVIVIDEFRMLVDEAPKALRELMRVASIGRSLGIHLVMATQRPQGALTADIRANVTSSIALRVQSDMESVDIINSRAAAAISVDTPGRAFLARGTEPPEEFQAASLASAGAGSQLPGVAVHLTTEYLTRGPNHPAIAAPTPVTPAQAVEPLSAMVRSLCAARDTPAPRRPVAPPLPTELDESAPDDPAGSAVPGWRCPPPVDSCGQVTLGLMDLPAEQLVKHLGWQPGVHSHAAFIGSPASGAGGSLEMTIGRLMASPREAHFYFLDGTGSFSELARESRTGAHAVIHDLRRGVRVLERLVEELGRRLAQPATVRVPLTVAISGWGSWVAAFRSGPLAWAEDLVQDLVRDGAMAGITLLLSGERELVTARFFAAIPNRFYFPAGSTEESRALWPRMPATAGVEGRAVAFGPIAGGGPAVCQFYRRPARDGGDVNTAKHPRASSPPFRVDPLPALITTGQVAALAALTLAQPSTPPDKAVSRPLDGKPRRSGGSSASGQVPGDRRHHQEVILGVAGDEAGAVSVRLPRGGVVAVLGNPGNGKSNTLQALVALNPEQPWCMPSESPESTPDCWGDLLLQAQGGVLPRDAVLLVDDVDLLGPPAWRALEQLNALGHSLVVAAAYSPALIQRVPLMMGARTSGVGLLLGPRSSADGDFYGVRFEVEPHSPPGRGVLISSGTSQALQVAWAGAEEKASGTG